MIDYRADKNLPDHLVRLVVLLNEIIITFSRQPSRHCRVLLAERFFWPLPSLTAGVPRSRLLPAAIIFSTTDGEDLKSTAEDEADAAWKMAWNRWGGPGSVVDILSSLAAAAASSAGFSSGRRAACTSTKAEAISSATDRKLLFDGGDMMQDD